MLNGKGHRGQRSIIGFDSAWTDKPRSPGAISIIRLDGSKSTFQEPQLATFDQALALIQAEHDACPNCLVALDQPTIVPNLSGLRPVDRVAASIISWAGGGVQPANRSKLGMFDDAAPLWRFKRQLQATEDPEQARLASGGLFLIEVFPALALLSIEDRFHGRLKAPRYNPARRKTFSMADWLSVLEGVAAFAHSRGLEPISEWCNATRESSPRKSDQDKVDSVICALVGFEWLVATRSRSVMIGDLDAGYMIAPVTPGVRARLAGAADRYGVTVA